ncbi:hypothetical protein NPX13_g11152 [Xylaria arbuscula]|uniref:Uncharacterized protein n=1 Tax=Xylaria arbuscula TaxID=114810 RepID=A0A9W8N3F1_9PEZI|nr:hypothetical protein NPX13_g11152 [Xylaria arbuscula]
MKRRRAEKKVYQRQVVPRQNAVQVAEDELARTIATVTQQHKEAIQADRLQRAKERSQTAGKDHQARPVATPQKTSRASQPKCDFTSLYVQLSRCRTLQGIKLLSPIRQQDFIGSKLDQTIVDAMQRLRNLADETRRMHGA